MPGFDKSVEFNFDEVVNERSGGTLSRLFEISPREELKVSWHRKRISIRPREGWRDNAVYTISMKKGMQDLSNNTLDTGRTIVFTTGDSIPSTLVTGTVIDWATHRTVPNALIEAISADSLVYIAHSDSVGNYRIGSLPRASYALLGVVDGNNNSTRDGREVFDSLQIVVDSTSEHILWTFAHDTTGPRLRTVTQMDSVTMKLEFNQHIQPSALLLTDYSVQLLPDSTPVRISGVMTSPVRDSLQERRADSLAAIADSVAAAADTLATDSTGAVEPDSLAAEIPDSTASDSLDVPDPGQIRTDSLLATRLRIFLEAYVILRSPTQPDTRLLFNARAVNLNGAIEESSSVLVIPALPPPDSSLTEQPDSALVETPDSLRAVPLDSGQVRNPDSLPGVPPDSSLGEPR